MRLLIVLLLAGCSGVPTVCENPFGAIGVGHKLGTSDAILMPSNEGGDNPTAVFEGGCEYESGYSVYLRHQSHWFDGAPFNNRAETNDDSIEIKKKWGSIK